MRLVLTLLLTSVLLLAQNVSKMNGVTIGASTGNYNSWNGLLFPGASGPNSFGSSPTQTGSCFFNSSNTTSCNISLGSSVTAGDADLIGCYFANGNSVPAAAISSVNISGTLLPLVGASTGSYPSAANTQASWMYILPSTSGSQASPVTVNFNQPLGEGWCYFAEYHPSSNGSLVGLDIDAGYQPSTASTSLTNISPTLSATNDAGLQGYMSVSGYVLATAVSSPYSTYSFLGVSGNGTGFGTSTPVSGIGPTWTAASSIVPLLSAAYFGWNPSACVEESFNDFTGGSGVVTTSQLVSSHHGYQGGFWNVSQVTHLSYDSVGAFELQNSTGRTCGDGGTYPTGAPNSGLKLGLVSTGVLGIDQAVYYWGYNNLAVVAGGQWYMQTFPPTDVTAVDCNALYGSQAHDFSSNNCYGDGTRRTLNLEAGSGNAPQAKISDYKATSVSASVSSGTITFTGTFTASQWPTSAVIVPSGCTGGSGINLVQFTILTSSSTTITANAGSASGSATGCQLNQWTWQQQIFTSIAGYDATVSGTVAGSTVTFTFSFTGVTGVSASVGSGLAAFTGTFTASQWATNTLFTVSGCSGGSGWNGTVFSVLTPSATTLTALAGSATGSPTGCTLTAKVNPAQWPVGTPFSVSGGSGGTNYNLSLFYVTGSTASTLTASTTAWTCSGSGCTPAQGTVSGSYSGGTLTGQHVLQISNAPNNITGIQWAASNGNDFPARWDVGNAQSSGTWTGGYYAYWGSYDHAFNSTAIKQ